MQHQKKKKKKKTTSLATSNMQKPKLNAYWDGWKKNHVIQILLLKKEMCWIPSIHDLTSHVNTRHPEHKGSFGVKWAPES